MHKRWSFLGLLTLVGCLSVQALPPSQAQPWGISPAQAKRQVVLIETPVAFGSGAHIGFGYFLTAAHVLWKVDPGKEVTLIYSDLDKDLTKHKAVVKFVNERTDVAVLWSKDWRFRRGLLLSEKDYKYRSDALLWSVACPAGIHPPLVSAGFYKRHNPDNGLVEISSGVYFGSSGGVVLDAHQGRIVGLIVRIGGRYFRDRPGGRWQSDLGYAVPIHTIRRSLSLWNLPLER